jgi:hypothetical protein
MVSERAPGHIGGVTNMVSQGWAQIAVAAACREQCAQMGEPLPDDCNGDCATKGCDLDASLIDAALAAVAPLIRAAAREEVIAECADVARKLETQYRSRNDDWAGGAYAAAKLIADSILCLPDEPAAIRALREG